MSTHSATRLRATTTLIGSLALVASLFATAPASAASPTACRVKDLDTGVTKASLQKAVGAASAGDRLRVQGICTGRTKITKRLTIIGIRTAASGAPTLKGPGSGTVLKITKRGVPVTVRNLTIRGGADGLGAGGGISNLGILTLDDVTVRGNNQSTGGGVWNDGRLILKGNTAIRDNTGNWGAGVDNQGLLVMKGTSSISANTASTEGGGVYNGDDGTLRMQDSSSIFSNTANVGGGVYLWDTATLVGAVCGLGGNVHDNTPDDCYFHDSP